MLDELHRIGFERLRFASMGRVHIYAACDEAMADATDPRYVPAVRKFTTPMADHEQAERVHLVKKWDVLLRSDLRPNQLAGMFVLDFPDIARHGFGPDLIYRTWFSGLRASLKEGKLPITHPHNDFSQPYRHLEWQYGNGLEPSYPAAPAHRLPTVQTPEGETQWSGDLLRWSARALQMVGELHRFGFEQLRFVSYGGHGITHIFAARDEVSRNCTDERFSPAVRRFNIIPGLDPSEDEYLAANWNELLKGQLRPNHLAGLFLLDFPDVARHSFGADQAYRQWFSGLKPYLERGVPVTHDHFSLAYPRRFLLWISGMEGSELQYPSPPPNPFLH